MASLRDELDHILKCDPAARTRLEVALTYPGFHAILLYRAANFLWRCHLKLVARFVSSFSRFITGVEIHPAATIGEYCFIDHGMGVVIGETTIIGNRVTLYQGVSLGGISLNKAKRHPTLGDDVVVGAGAKLLGPIEVGAGARIGANAVLLTDAEAGAVMVGIPARIRAADDVSDALMPAQLYERITALEARLARLEKGGAASVSPAPRSGSFDA